MATKRKTPEKVAVNQEEIKNKPFDEDIVKGIYKFITPQEADNAIKGQLDEFRKSPNRHPWPASLLLIRNSIILEYICTMGLSNYQTACQISDRWGISVGTAQQWTGQALKALALHADENLEDARTKHLERLESILKTALENGSNDTALKVTDQIAKVLGIYSEKKDINVKAEENITFEFQ